MNVSPHRINIFFVLKVVGAMALFEGVFVLAALVLALAHKEAEWQHFLITLLSTSSIGAIFSFIGRRPQEAVSLGKREGMLAVTLTWFTLSCVGMLPFLLGRGYSVGVAASFFEAVSGFTTTGFTVFADVESLPKSILFWRAIMQWHGGIGIVVFTIALLPMLGTGAGLLLDAETTGVEHERFLPRITTAATKIWLVYLVLTVLLIALLLVGKMNVFDSVCHAFACISTGGFSTKNASIAAYNSPYIEYVISLFMVIGSLDFTVLYFASRGRLRRLLTDEQFRWFIGLVVTVSVITGIWLLYIQWTTDTEYSFRTALFQVSSLISSTGFTTANINEWKPFFWCLALFIMLIGGCAGSTAGGIKVSRFIILLKNMGCEFRRRTHVSLVTHVRVDQRILSDEIVDRVMAFFFLYLGLIAAGVTLLTLYGNNFETSVSIAVASISNIGASFGTYQGGFSQASDPELYILSFLMLAGRLEVFTVMSLFTQAFWKR